MLANQIQRSSKSATFHDRGKAIWLNTGKSVNEFILLID